jgi:hypothetical protein
MRYRTLPLILVILLAILLLAAIPASAVKTSEASIDDTLTRGSRFTVTVTGLPNTTYYIWLPRTFSMSGEPYDQPPVIADFTQNFRKDPEGGPYTIGSYQYYNGDGRTIIDDVAPATASMSNTNYYGQVRTDAEGIAVVEFQTSVYTGTRSYSVKVENPDSADTDRLAVDLSVYTRRAPTLSITAPEKTPRTTKPPIIITTAAPSPEPTIVETIPVTPSPPAPVKTMVTTTKAAAFPYSAACALLALFLLCRKSH